MARPPLEVGKVGATTETQLPNGRWLVQGRLRAPSGATVKVKGSGATRTAARDAFQARVHLRMKGAGSRGITPTTRVAVLLTRWLEERVNDPDDQLADRSVDEYRRVIEFLKPRLGALRIAELDPGLVDDLLKEIRRSTPGRAKQCRTVLNQACSWAVRRNAIPTNPVHDLTPMVGLRKKRTKALDADQRARLRAAVAAWQAGDKRRSSDIANILELMLATGARIGEVLALRWEDADFTTTPVTVWLSGTETWDTATGHHRQEGRKGHAADADADHGRHPVALPKWAADRLLELRVDAGANSLVFPSRAGTLRSQHNVRRSLREALVGTEFEKAITPHTLRATVASVVARASGVQAAADQLGHAETTTTERHYIARKSVAVNNTQVLDALGPASTP